MFSFIFALLWSFGFFAAPAMDADPAPTVVAASWDVDTASDAPAQSATNPCAPVLLEEGVDYSALFEAGYQGNPSDHVEALYAPGC